MLPLDHCYLLCNGMADDIYYSRMYYTDYSGPAAEIKHCCCYYCHYYYYMSDRKPTVFTISLTSKVANNFVLNLVYG